MRQLFMEEPCEHGKLTACDQRRWLGSYGQYEDCPGGTRTKVNLVEMLAGVSDLADRYQVQPNTVAVWTQRHADFPEPLIQVGGRVRVWWVPDVDQWVQNRS